MPGISKDHARELSVTLTPLRVVLADDHAILRQGLRAMFNAETDLEVVGDAGNVPDALSLIQRLQPDVLITNSVFTKSELLAAAEPWHRQCLGMRVIVLTENRDEHLAARAPGGVYAHISKDSPVELLLQAIRAQLTPISIARECEDVLREIGRAATPTGSASTITARELQVLIGIAMGYSSKRIAGNLGRSVKTIEKHRFKMMHKLNLSNAAGATRYALEHGLLERSLVAFPGMTHPAH